MILERLPVDAALGEIHSCLLRARAVVVVAAPGAGKTTRIPPALVDHGPVLVLQPRRAAARSIAQRIAREQQWTIGEDIGWHIRFEKRVGPKTQIVVATEGILTARLQADPLLSDFATVVLDEFHERSIHADLGLALVKQAWQARTDLRVVVMSATLDAQPIADFLGGCPIVTVPGALFPVTIEYAPQQPLDQAAMELLSHSEGDILCFLPGAREIADAAARLTARLNGRADVCVLHGSLDAAEQDRVLAGETSSRRRIILATNLAETSVTVGGVRAVVDSGLHKVARYDAARGVDGLFTERISADSAGQRAGRAGRLGPGVVRRLWHQADRLRPHREAEIRRVDLADVVLDVLAWGGDPEKFEWFEAPADDRVASAMTLLERLGAVQTKALTDLGRRMQRLPVHPRHARILLAGQANRDLVRACALLSEQAFLPPRRANTSSDLLSALDAWAQLPMSVHQSARELARSIKAHGIDADTAPADEHGDAAFRWALFSGYPDRAAQRRASRAEARFKLATGIGAILSNESGVRDADYVVALDLRESAGSDAVIRIASRIEPEWLTLTSRETLHRIDEAGRLRAADVERYDAIVLAERPVPPAPEIGARLLAAAWLEAPPSPATTTLLRRLAFAGCPIDLPSLALAAAYGVQSVDEISIASHLDHETRRCLDAGAPETLIVPSGRSVRLEYLEDGSVSASVKLQELFGLADTPRVGMKQEPVLLELLAPNQRPIQRTRDLGSFWNRTYPEVRKELRGRYPKHPWPEDPWTALPTAKAKPRR